MGAKHEFVQPYLMQPKMEQLLESYRNSTEHIIPRLARVHIELEGIHPFIDGNGWTGKHNLDVMEKVFAGYVYERLDSYLTMFDVQISEQTKMGIREMFPISKYINLY